jgi:DNA-binding NarL/FixJ family response regulator
MAARILLVDDHEMFRQGIKALLEGSLGYTVCGEASNGQEAIEKVGHLKPDLVLMDISMPVMNGIEATKEIGRLFPAAKVIILTMHDSSEVAKQAKAVGAVACIVKGRSVQDLGNAITEVLGHRSTAQAQPGF